MIDVAYTLMWRRFINLVMGLGSESMFKRAVYLESNPHNNKRNEKVVEDPKAIAGAIKSIFLG